MFRGTKELRASGCCFHRGMYVMVWDLAERDTRVYSEMRPFLKDGTSMALHLRRLEHNSTIELPEWTTIYFLFVDFGTFHLEMWM